ncbi:Macrolide export protein MacA [Rosistilla ulvae]|uniref:Macrolide export protein MacA n=1 Tax=Rosistilla ulvae TaxID=1930277 RepID=A0A517M762_9BACT|nr:HlyD family efflux transporter periplasmic adaptor subunit [Rosistilla ulvae]QDS90716.1 Macrolide export protein MacA [Rosistilla ulvae]
MTSIVDAPSNHPNRGSLSTAGDAALSNAGESQALAAALELMIQMEAIDDLSSAATVAGDVIGEFCRARRVVVGWCRDGTPTCEVIADTDATAHDPASPIHRKLQFALDEIIVRGQTVELDVPANLGQPSAALALRQFALAVGCTRLAGSPLSDATGQIRGAWLFIDPAEQIESLRTPHLIDSLSRPLGARLATIWRHQPGRLDRALDTVRDAFTNSRGSVAIAGLMVLLFVMLFPIHYSVRCDCALQPVSRRLIAAPFDGSLEKSFVDPGDLIDEGALLARISARELNWERAGLQAELNRSNKERQVSLAKQDYAASQIAQLDSQQVAHRLQMIESRIEHLDIRSPFKGVVIAGDIKEVEGAPLETGQTLFEIAPVGEMIVELRIPEADFAYVRPQMPVRLRLHAFPTQRIEGVVEQVHPKAEVIDNENVFVAKIRIEDPHAIYRPGMHGRASIQSDRRPLMWVLFHKPWSALMMWLGW